MRTLLNIVIFQIGWFTCILGAAGGRPWTGVLFIAAAAVFHLAWMTAAVARTSEALLMVMAAAFGWIGDSVLVMVDLLAFPPGASIGGPSTWWMVALWVNLAMTFRHSMGWMRGRYAVATLFGLFGGPMAYWAGARLGAVELPLGTWPALAGVAVLWGAAMPGLLIIERRTSRLLMKGIS